MPSPWSSGWSSGSTTSCESCELTAPRGKLDHDRRGLRPHRWRRALLPARRRHVSLRRVRVGVVERSHLLWVGCVPQQRAAAIAELERLLPAPEQTLGPLTEAVTRVLEAVGTVLRSRFERLRTMANTQAAEIDEWSRRVGRPLRVPRVTFAWPPAAVSDALLTEAVEAPKVVWDDDPQGTSRIDKAHPDPRHGEVQ